MEGGRSTLEVNILYFVPRVKGTSLIQQRNSEVLDRHEIHFRGRGCLMNEDKEEILFHKQAERTHRRSESQKTPRERGKS